MQEKGKSEFFYDDPRTDFSSLIFEFPLQRAVIFVIMLATEKREDAKNVSHKSHVF